MTRPDLDALEKLAESLATLDSEERDWPLVKIHGRMFHVENVAKAASDGLTALIAELKEAREHLARCVELVPAPGAIEAADAFLARNGKGKG